MNGTTSCRYCGAALAAADRFCGSCGQARAEQLREEPTQQHTGIPGEPAPASDPTGQLPPIPQPMMPTAPRNSMTPPWTQPTPEVRYGSLRTIATIFTVLGWIVVVVGAIAVIATAASVGSFSAGGRLGVLVFGLIYVALYALGLIAIGAFIRLMLSIEQSARESAQSAREAVGLLSR